MHCERCGRFTLFKKLCNDCATEQNGTQALQGGASATPSKFVASTFVTTFPAGTVKAKTQTTVSETSKLRVQGQEIPIDLSNGLTSEVLDEVSSKLKMPREKVQALLGPYFSKGDLADLAKQAMERKAAAVSASTITCPACQHQAPLDSAFCPKCGEALPGPAS